MEIKILYDYFNQCSSISTDTRKIEANSMFFALKGENFNGNSFVSKAFENGAKFCVVDEKDTVINSNCLLVANALIALQQLATYHREQIQIPIIALTGSNGKTTTKELIHSVLATTYKVMATKGNLNNHIGVPLTLLSFTEDLDFGIVEMGANHQKEIEFLSQIAKPDYGLITNFGKAHLEGFGGVEGVIKGKSELYDFLRNNNKTAFINTDDDTQVSQISSYKNIITFGSKSTNDCIIQFNEASPFVKLNYSGIIINSKLIGTYNFNNIAIAIAIGTYFKVEKNAIQQAIENYEPTNNRSQIIKLNSNTIILDAYNANPTSMLAALRNFEQLKTENKYLFLGDMFELGEEAEEEHQNITDFVEITFSSNRFLIGENFAKTKTNTPTKTFEKFELIIPELEKLNLKEATILIKGSRGMALERILNFI